MRELRLRQRQGDYPQATNDQWQELGDADYRPVREADLGALLSRSGVTPETTVVAYGYGAPLGFWLLKAYGHVGDEWGAPSSPTPPARGNRQPRSRNALSFPRRFPFR